MARTKTVTKSKKDGVKKRTVTKSTKRRTTTKSSVRSGGKTLSKSKEKRKDGFLVLDKTKNQSKKIKSRIKRKGDVYSDKTTFKEKGQRKGKIKTKEISGKKSKGNETYVTQKTKRYSAGEKKSKLGYYVGSGTSGKRRTYSRVKK